MKDTQKFYPMPYICGHCHAFQVMLDGSDDNYEKAREKMAEHRKECRRER